MSNELKTNALRILDQKKISYEFMTYEDDGFHDGVTIATTLGIPIKETYKTIVTISKSKKFYVFVLPVDCELDLKKCAIAVKEKSIELLDLKDLTNITGYIRGGCSPIGMKKIFLTIMDSSALLYPKIYVSGGRRGLQIHIRPQDLEKIIPIRYENIIVEKSSDENGK